MTSTKDIVESGTYGHRAKPTDAELAILRVLWVPRPGTVRQVHDALTEAGAAANYDRAEAAADHDRRRASWRVTRPIDPHVYSARLSEGETQRQLLDDLLGRAFRRIGHEAGDAGALGRQGHTTELAGDPRD